MSSLALVPLFYRCEISQFTSFRDFGHRLVSTPLRGSASSLALVPLSDRCEISQFTSFQGPTFLLATVWCLPSLGLSVLTGTPPDVHPLQGSTSLLAHRPVFGSDTICNSPRPPLTDIVLFRFSLSDFPARFLKHVC